MVQGYWQSRQHKQGSVFTLFCLCLIHFYPWYVQDVYMSDVALKGVSTGSDNKEHCKDKLF